MSDQAENLRNMMRENNKHTNKNRGMKIITVVDDKKRERSFATNIAICMKEYGVDPIILETDSEFLNRRSVQAEEAKFTLSHLLNRKCGVEQIIVKGEYDISFISAQEAITDMLSLSPSQLGEVANELNKLEDKTDVLLISISDVINERMLKFSAIGDEVYIIITSESDSIMNGYAVIKTLVKHLKVKTSIKIITSQIKNEKEGEQIYQRIRQVAHEFLGVDVDYAGSIPHNESTREDLNDKMPIAKRMPTSQIGKAYRKLAGSFVQEGFYDEEESWGRRLGKLL